MLSAFFIISAIIFIPYGSFTLIYSIFYYLKYINNNISVGIIYVWIGLLFGPITIIAGVLNLTAGKLGLKTSKNIILNSPFTCSNIAIIYYLILMSIFRSTVGFITCISFIFAYIIYFCFTYKIQRKLLN